MLEQDDQDSQSQQQPAQPVHTPSHLPNWPMTQPIPFVPDSEPIKKRVPEGQGTQSARSD
jgi:hypothetical protein